MNLTTTIQRNTNMVFNELDGEIVMMNLEKGEYYGLNPVGSCIWELLANPMTVEALIAQLIEEFDVSPNQCQADIELFIDDMIEKKMIVRVE